MGEDRLSGGWFEANVRRGLGDGQGVNFWNHHWIGQRPLKMDFSNIFAGCSNKNAYIADLGVWNQSYWRWNLTAFGFDSQLLSEDGSTLFDILRDVQLNRDRTDSWSWLLEPSHRYSVRSCYRFLLSANSVPAVNTNGDSIDFKALWQTETTVPSKILIFGWRLILNALPVRELLRSRQVIRSEEGPVRFL